MTTPTHMKATVLSKIGGPDGFEFSDRVPVPELKDGFVIVRNTFASVNFADVYFRTGVYPSSQDSNLILGQEASGFVEAVPENNPFGIQKGDRVVWIFQGGYAQYTAVPITQVIKVPSGIADEDAAGVFLAGMTALTLIDEAFTVKAGDSVLVQAAAGGVGLLLCQALRDRGALVIGTAGGREKCDLALQHGASHMIDYREEMDWPQKVQELTNGEGVDVVYDGVGKDTWEGSLAAVKVFGKFVFIGNASGPVPLFSLDRLTAKNISIMRPTLRNYISTRGRLERYGNKALDMVKAGKWKVQKHGHFYSLEEIEQAHKDLETRVTTGKVLIRV
ncbi:hypothetical protein PENVUL_c037G09085 [Penicillium vulpinum]|uniref:Probable quinone oxidoreductase n=1 Tax=Penicillium vulpinum TaxID=29845 RepID=A0A1V6RN69_9EURO|nr:hypothetical protein PENVUL_c037G09085 [Penicillium vulpinum]